VIEGSCLTSTGRFLVREVWAEEACAVKAKTEVRPPGLSAFRIVSAAKKTKRTATTTTDPAVLNKPLASVHIDLRLYEAWFIEDTGVRASFPDAPRSRIVV